MGNEINTAKLALSMREELPIIIGDKTIHVDRCIYMATLEVLSDTGNQSAEVIEYLDKIKSQITEIQKGLKSL